MTHTPDGSVILDAGEVLRRRHEIPASQKELSRMAEVDVNTIKAIEAAVPGGKGVRPRTARALAKVFECSVSDLIHLYEEAYPGVAEGGR